MIEYIIFWLIYRYKCTTFYALPFFHVQLTYFSGYSSVPSLLFSTATSIYCPIAIYSSSCDENPDGPVKVIIIH